MGNDVYLYPGSIEYARQRNEIALWRESWKANIACKKAIEEAIRRDFDGMHLNPDCADGVIAEYGFKRVNFVLANTIQEKAYDGRFSGKNKEWAKMTAIPPDKEHNYKLPSGKIAPDRGHNEGHHRHFKADEHTLPQRLHRIRPRGSRRKGLRRRRGGNTQTCPADAGGGREHQRDNRGRC